MSKRGFSEIVCIVDRSGSMESIKSDAIGGYNSFIEEQKKVPGEASLTYIQFDTEYEVVYENKSLKDVPVLDGSVYVPRGYTALLDAIGRSINDVGARLAKTNEEDRPEKVIFAILTDGLENASKEFNRDKIFEMITHQRETYKWEFVFLGANQDAIKTGVSYGIDAGSSYNFDPTGKGVRTGYMHMSDTIGKLRTNKQ